MKKIIIIVVLSLFFVSCSNNSGPVTTSESNNKNALTNNKSELSNERQSSSDNDLEYDEVMEFKGVFLDTYIDVPNWDPMNPDKEVLFLLENTGKAIGFFDFSMIYGDFNDVMYDIYNIDSNALNNKKDIIFETREYLQSFLQDMIVIDGDVISKLDESGIVIKDEIEKEISKINFSVLKGVFEAYDTAEVLYEVYYYGYFGYVDDFPFYYLIIDEDEDVVNSKTVILDKMMESFRVE